MTDLGLLLVFLFLVVLGPGAGIGGVRLAFWKLLVTVGAFAVAVALGATLAR